MDWVKSVYKNEIFLVYNRDKDYSFNDYAFEAEPLS
jgi:hypothetical protein